jgi:flagellar motor switch protein FliN/FliY
MPDETDQLATASPAASAGDRPPGEPLADPTPPSPSAHDANLEIGPAESTTALQAGQQGPEPGDIELLLRHAQQALASAVSDSPPLPQGVKPFELPDLSGAPPSTEMATFELIRDVELDLKIELGRTHMYLEDVLKLRKGAVVALDKLAGDPVDIYVNGRLIPRGEILVMNDNFCVRVAQLVAGRRPEPA